jgi:anti-anti-sigma regulatory factor
VDNLGSAMGGRLGLCAAGPDLLRVFRFTQLDRVFSLYPTEQEALRSFGD